MMHRLSPPSLPLLAFATLCAGGVSCSSTPEKEAKPIYENAVVADTFDVDKDVASLFLQLDRALIAWNKLTLEADDPREAQKAQALKEDITFKSTRYQKDLIQALESGPPFQRQIAALALGFSEVKALPSDARDQARAHRISPMVPLQAALNDPLPAVVSNALLAIGLQADPNTPTEQMITLLATSEDNTLRANASWALKRLADVGAPMPGVLPVARRALSDAEAGVRSQCALILARHQDPEAIDSLAGLLRDETNAPAFAAARGLAYIGSRNDPLKGACARALVDALEDTRPEVQGAVLSNLIALSERNFGKHEIAEWRRWAARLP